jgi:cyanophycinase-like exopeptidase
MMSVLSLEGVFDVGEPVVGFGLAPHEPCDVSLDHEENVSVVGVLRVEVVSEVEGCSIRLAVVVRDLLLDRLEAREDERADHRTHHGDRYGRGRRDEREDDGLTHAR